MQRRKLRLTVMRSLHHACFFSVLLLSFSINARAGFSETEYFDALKIAEKKVERTKPTGLSANALSSAILDKTLGRKYRIGDHWTVAAWHEEPSIARPFARSGEPDAGFNGRAGVFRYEVVATDPEVKIEIRQLEAFGVNSVDPRVDILTIQLNDTNIQVHKSYFGRSGYSFRVSPEGIHSGATLLELFPLDVPEIITAEQRVPGRFPKLPSKLQSIRARARAELDLSRSIWFEQDDFFGRPIQILWEKGSPWPHYLKTPGGVAILLGKVES